MIYICFIFRSGPGVCRARDSVQRPNEAARIAVTDGQPLSLSQHDYRCNRVAAVLLWSVLFPAVSGKPCHPLGLTKYIFFWCTAERKQKSFTLKPTQNQQTDNRNKQKKTPKTAANAEFEFLFPLFPCAPFWFREGIQEFRDRKKSSQQNPRKPKINYPEDGKNIPSRKSSSTEQGTKKRPPH